LGLGDHPRPLIDFRRAEEIEQNIVELHFPQLADWMTNRASTPPVPPGHDPGRPLRFCG
jgi:hypothetical protein